ncbi:MAG: LysM peptidoglycan-binding domain-containing protein [Chloroflexi bacterium]|nr:LysM peptidoglycan-binding domain-containing protein [Chloroflexota bacterium]
MSPETNTSANKVCPTCGTRLSDNATRCLVCGRNFTTSTNKSPTNPVQGQKLPELKLSLPAALGLVVLVLGLGAALIYVILQTTGNITTPTTTPTITITPTSTNTPFPTLEPTAAPTPTNLPPLEYNVKAGDFCSTIALIYKVSITSIAELNNLPPDCGTLYENQIIFIPIPTATASPMPTATLSAVEATASACGTVQYQVQSGDTLYGISLNYSISMESIKSFNNLSSDTVNQGQYLSLPLCERLPTQGPTPTPTLPPPYTSASLLLPADGSVYTNFNDPIVLQWSSVGTLRDTEAYAVTVEDVSTNGEKKIVEYVQDTKLIVPANIRPLDNTNHIFRWSVVVVRQTGTTADGQPLYTVFGQTSLPRVFGWSGTGEAITPTP